MSLSPRPFDSPPAAPHSAHAAPESAFPAGPLDGLPFFPPVRRASEPGFPSPAFAPPHAPPQHAARLPAHPAKRPKQSHPAHYAHPRSEKPSPAHSANDSFSDGGEDVGPIAGTGEVKRRARVSRACDSCSKHKKKCDGKEPCTSCALRSAECTYTSTGRKRGPAPGSRPQYAAYVASLEDRLAKMEEMVEAASVLAMVQDFRAPCQPASHPAPRPPTPASVSGDERPRSPAARTPSVSSSNDDTLHQTTPANHPAGRFPDKGRVAELEHLLASRSEQLREARIEAEYWKQRFLEARPGEEEVGGEAGTEA
ncbi:hypothetical protein DFJ74DRAFT_664445 [Hyaloraphidium curvatum]|nr:hypothetical protein DFJ74DRAFT_664445 [Hyaloraphidium curvatum]